jgi:hypothetical protein
LSNLGHLGLQGAGGSGAAGASGFSGFSGATPSPLGLGIFGSSYTLMGGGSDYEASWFNSPGGNPLPQPQVAFRIPMPVAGNVNNLKVHVTLNTRGGATVYTVWKNGADTGLTLSVGAGATGDFSASGAVAFAAGDLISLRINATASVASGQISSSQSVQYTT